MKNLYHLSFIIMLSFSIGITQAQPYLDLGQATFWASPGENNQPKKFNQLRTQLNLPIINKKDSSVFLINPIWEERWILVNDTTRNVNLRGLITWFTYTHRLGKKWSLMVAAIPRWVGEPSVQFSNGFQMGGAALLIRRFRPGLQLKAGMYYNKEFFGNFFLPLIGIDWQINKKMNLFGILPGSLTFEHRLTDRLAWGGALRTFTNSHRLVEGSLVQFEDYIRINDVQLGIFSDVYLTKKIVFNLEAGHTLLREFSSAKEGLTGKDNLTVLADKDNFYFKASLQYRLRFR
jgi:Domain of unknown function (DUF6268)